MSALQTAPAVADDEPPSSLWRDAWYRLRRNKLAIVGLTIIVLLALVSIFGPWLTPHDFLSQNLELSNNPPSWQHPFGTDDLGRDVLSRVIYGTRTAFIVGAVVTVISLLIGVLLGVTAGFLGGWWDRGIMWFTDVTMSVPNLLLVIVINTSLKRPANEWMEAMYLATLNPIYRETVWVDFVLVFGSMALVSWPPYARLVRAQVLSIRQRPYITAARALGLPPSTIMLKHVLPNALGPLIIAASAGMGSAMVMESAFSFLGIGVSPPTPSWGNMISDGLRVWRHYPHLLAIPALVLAVITVAFSFLGDGLNDALNPKGNK